MKVVVWVPGRVRPRALEMAEKVYADRLALVKVDVVSYRLEKVRSGFENQAQMREGKAFLKQVRVDDFLVVCDERGSRRKTADVVKLLELARGGSELLSGRGRLIFAIGGAYGFSEAVRARADELWSLSDLVMAGGVARLVLLEALYRGAMIVEGHPYHND
ncbi:MAG: 23S rRNA (pseudouridine(1915)-N(3))-methyltransferase RlmH [Pontiellaceae bacterium]|nr:hypothetical protein [Kiritimatiellaceae bacterium]HBO87190.1 hypothetical protein [Verrucomicrobiota bacterium]